MIARTLGLLRMGNIALDGSKINANASKHTALSYGQIKKLEVYPQVAGLRTSFKGLPL